MYVCECVCMYVCVFVFVCVWDRDAFGVPTNDAWSIADSRLLCIEVMANDDIACSLLCALEVGAWGAVALTFALKLWIACSRALRAAPLCCARCGSTR